MDPNKCKSTDWPILGLIWQNCCSFYEKFVSVDNNWEKCPIMFNPLLRTGRGGEMIGPEFFRHNIPPIPLVHAKEITVREVYENGNLKQLDVINNNLPVQLSLASYMRIAGTVQYWKKKC
jgi:hypothetical protein